LERVLPGAGVEKRDPHLQGDAIDLPLEGERPSPASFERTRWDGRGEGANGESDRRED
jgi:hypothetical protein